MPRVAYSGEEINNWNDETGCGTSDWDVCAECWNDIECAHNSDGIIDDDWVYDELQPDSGEPKGTSMYSGIDHPPYDDGWHIFKDGHYRCEICNKALDPIEDD